MRGRHWPPRRSACTRRCSHPWEAAYGRREPRGHTPTSFIDAVPPSNDRRSEDRRRMDQEQHTSCHRRSKQRHGRAEGRQALIVSEFSVRTTGKRRCLGGNYGKISGRGQAEGRRRAGEDLGGVVLEVIQQRFLTARRLGTEHHILVMEASGCIQAANGFVGLPVHFYTKQDIPLSLTSFAAVLVTPGDYRRAVLADGSTATGWLAHRSHRTPLSQPC